MAVRYFPVSQDINADPEVWELTDKFGVTGLRAWLEVLSIADRNNGTLPGLWESYPRLLAARCQSTTRHLLGVCQFITRWLVVNSQGIASIRNYSKYHKLRAERGLAPNLPNHPNHHKNDTTAPKSDLSVRELVESWNESFRGKLPAVEWPLSVSRHRKAVMRLKEHQRLDFWQRVFDNLGSSDFLMGRNNGTWRATLDFLIANDSNCIKIYEGAYNGKTGYNQQRR